MHEQRVMLRVGWARPQSHRAAKDAALEPAATKYVGSVIEFRSEMFANVIRALDSISETDGSTVLANTIVLYTVDCGYGHSHGDYFCILGGAGASLKAAGTMVRVGNGTTNDVLTSIARYMGADVDRSGDPALGNGPMPERVFSV